MWFAGNKSHLLKFVNTDCKSSCCYTQPFGEFLHAHALIVTDYLNCMHLRRCQAAVHEDLCALVGRHQDEQVVVQLLALKAQHGLPLGIDDQTEYADESITLRAGDRMLFYTDGLVEARDASDRFLAMKTFDEILGRDDRSASDTMSELVCAVTEHTGSCTLEDDLHPVGTCRGLSQGVT